jgi:hypothetical protein
MVVLYQLLEEMAIKITFLPSMERLKEKSLLEVILRRNSLLTLWIIANCKECPFTLFTLFTLYNTLVASIGKLPPMNKNSKP